MGEVVELNFAKEGSRDRRGCESPRFRIAAEFEASDEQPDADAGLGAGDQWELREDVGSTGSRHRDPYQPVLGLGCLDLANHTGNRDFGSGRLPLVLGAEPRDGFFMGLDLGCRGLDAAGVDDLFEFLAGRVVEDMFGRIGASKWLVWAGNGDQLDNDFYGEVPREGKDGTGATKAKQRWPEKPRSEQETCFWLLRARWMLGRVQH